MIALSANDSSWLHCFFLSIYHMFSLTGQVLCPFTSTSCSCPVPLSYQILLYHTCLKKATTEMVHMFSIAPKANHIGALGSCHMRGRCFFFRLTSGLMEGDSSSFISSVYIFLWPSQCQLLSKLFSPFFMFVWQTFFGWKKLLLYPRAPIIFGKYNKNNENIIKSGEMSLNVINDVDSAQKIIWLKILLQQIF